MIFTIIGFIAIICMFIGFVHIYKYVDKKDKQPKLSPANIMLILVFCCVVGGSLDGELFASLAYRKSHRAIFVERYEKCCKLIDEYNSTPHVNQATDTIVSSTLASEVDYINGEIDRNKLYTSPFRGLYFDEKIAKMDKICFQK